MMKSVYLDLKHDARRRFVEIYWVFRPEHLGVRQVEWGGADIGLENMDRNAIRYTVDVDSSLTSQP
jgi:hypothetical protein